jgi:serine/threonine protein kinase
MRALRLSTAPDGRARDNAVAGSESSAIGAPAWRLVELLGRGGTAEVWRAVDPAGQPVALKRLHPALRARAGATQCLRREHDWLIALAGGPFVASRGWVEGDGGPWLALEYLPGGDLVSLVGARPAHWLPALRRVAEAVAALAAAGVAHGDVKARNVLFGADGDARVIDLLAARPLDAPAPPGTAAYRPAGEPVTAGAADAFALAALAFELLTGRLPYGLAGQAFVGEAPVLAARPESSVAILAAVACRELAAGGRRGLSPLLDVIESVHAG